MRRSKETKCRSVVFAGALLLLTLGTGSVSFGEAAQTEASGQETSAAYVPDEAQLERARNTDTTLVADASDMTTVEEVETGEPVTADQLNDGTYALSVESSSSMFTIDACTVTVQDGTLRADLTLAGTGYLFLYAGSAQEAAEADPEEFVYYEEDADGKYVYRNFALEALDAPVACAAFSAKKGQWYPRTLVFRSEQLPEKAWREGSAQGGETLSPENGSYTVGAILEGSGKLSAESPALLEAEDGALTVTLVLDSAKVDYVVSDGEKLLPREDAGEGQTVFCIPVEGTVIDLVVDSTAIAGKHVEKDYRLILDADTLEQVS